MKKITCVAVLLLLVFGGCKKTTSLVPTDITTTEAANLIAGTLSTNANGFITATTDITLNSQLIFDTNIGCGATKAYTATHTNPSGSVYIYSNTYSYNYTLNCNTNNLPDNVTGSASDNGSFDGPNLSSTNSGTATFRVAGLSPTSLVYVINGEYKRTGSFTSKVDSKSTGTSTVDIIVSNLTINKLTKVIVSGTATVTVTGTTAKGTAINFNGNLTFTGDGNATATVNGTVYIVNLLTGEITKK